MSDHDEAIEMLALAEVDLHTTQLMLKDPAFSEASFGFHAQQATEKALKSWLSLYHVEYPFTHNLRALFLLLEKNGIEVEAKFIPLAALSPFGAQLRYSFAPVSGEPLDRVAVVQTVEELIAAVKAQI